jgi:hypothetical protein
MPHGATSKRAGIHRAAGGNRPELFDAVGADPDIPVVEVDGGFAVAGDEADLVAEAEAVGGARDAEAAVLVGGALVGGGGLVADERRAGVARERLEAGVDDGAVLGRTASPSPGRRGSARSLGRFAPRSRFLP